MNGPSSLSNKVQTSGLGVTAKLWGSLRDSSLQHKELSVINLIPMVAPGREGGSGRKRRQTQAIDNPPANH